MRPGRLLPLLAILAVASLLRLPALATKPPALFADEAYTGYDAYCLARTGADLWGRPWPLYFPSWGGDAEEGLYRYLCLPFVALLGPVPLAVRLPAALAGILTVACTYLLGRRLLGEAEGRVAAFLLAVSPWHVTISRIGFRAILLPLLVTACAWLAARASGRQGTGEGNDPHPRAWALAVAAGGAALYTYSVAKVFVPLFGLLLAWIFRAEVRRRPAAAALLLALSGAIAGPAVWETLAGRGQVRFARISALRAEVLRDAAEDLRRDLPAAGRAPEGAQRLIAAGGLLARNYLSHASPSFLFVAGDGNLRHGPGRLGQLYWVEGALLLLGLGRAARRRSTADLWLIGWLLLGPLGDSLTSDRVPNALRALVTLPAPQLLAGSGAALLLAWVVPLRSRCAAAAAAAGLLLLAALALEVGRFVERYATTYPADAAPFFNAGYMEGIAALAARAPAGAPLLVARPEDWRVERYALNPYLHSLVLLTTRRPPELWQTGGGLGRFDVVRIPEQGTIRPADLPPGAWLLLPADRVAPSDAERLIRDPGGRPGLAILAAPNPG